MNRKVLQVKNEGLISNNMSHTTQNENLPEFAPLRNFI